MTTTPPKSGHTLVTQTSSTRPEFLPDLSRKHFHVVFHDAKGSHRTSIEGAIAVGSAEGAGIHILDKAVSRLHCELRVRDNDLWVKDLDSKNGTWVNGVRVTEACLREGLRLQVGNTELLVGRDTVETALGLWPHERFGAMVGRSTVMRETFSLLQRFAASNAPVLLLGETGTGKDEAARAIHTFSKRNRKPFIVVDCGTLSLELIESELFGHARGAFTGAETDRAGCFEEAHEGTVFLDEIGELPLDSQTRLLRVLETGEVKRLGEQHPRKVNVRVIAATHRDLRTMVNQETFREDLYFRLAILQARLPPLRERPDDLALLWQEMAPEHGTELDAETLSQLRAHPWSGNVREFRSYIARHAAGLPQPEPIEQEVHSELPTPAVDVPFKTLREEWNDHLERTYFGKLLKKHDSNVTQVARAAEVNRTYVHRLIKKHDL